MLSIMQRRYGNDVMVKAWPDFMEKVGDWHYPQRISDYTGQCPITLMDFVDPVMASDGFVYERNAILTWLTKNSRSPLTREGISSQVVNI